MSQCELMPMPVPSVMLHNGRPATTSLEVAKFFGKRHDAVLRDINTITSNCPESFSAHNFVGASYLDEQAKNRPMYIIYRDGFMLLVMGYTGKKALAIKLAYIEAFNAMEAKIQKQESLSLPEETPASPGSVSITPSTVEDRKPLRALVNVWAHVSAQPFNVCWTQLKVAFQLNSIRDLPKEWVFDALAWVQAKIDALPAVPAPARTPVLPASSIYADRMKALTDLEKRFMEFAGETRTRLSELNAEYIRLNQGAYAAMLGMIPTIDFAAKDRLIDALASQSYDAYNWIDEGLHCMRRAILAARAANRALSGRS